MVAGHDKHRRPQGGEHRSGLLELNEARPLGQIPAYGDKIDIGGIDFIDQRPDDAAMRNLAEMQIRYMRDPESAHRAGPVTTYSNMESGSSR